jgi:hypothetical protein
MNTPSACLPAKALPAGELPAWKITGVRWGEGSDRAIPGTVKYLPLCSIGCTFDGSAKTPVATSRTTASSSQLPSQSLTLVGGGHRDREAKVPGHGSHRWNHEERVVCRGLDAVAQGGVHPALVDVQRAERPMAVWPTVFCRRPFSIIRGSLMRFLRVMVLWSGHERQIGAGRPLRE